MEDTVPGVYLSYPFCAQKCTYCNFASGVFPRELEARYPTVYAKLQDGRFWTREAEEELLRLKLDEADT